MYKTEALRQLELYHTGHSTWTPTKIRKELMKLEDLYDIKTYKGWTVFGEIERLRRKLEVDSGYWAIKKNR